MPDIYVRILHEPELVLEACALLYNEYIARHGWQFSSYNPSRLRVEKYKGQNILVDRFVAESTWFGVFEGKELIGCTRLCGRDEKNKFEVEGYPSSWPIQPFLAKQRARNCVEVGRGAIKHEYISRGIAKYLGLAFFQYCETKHYSIFTCTAEARLGFFYRDIGWPLIEAQAFKYELQDPEAVNFYFADYAKGEIIQIINKLKASLAAPPVRQIRNTPPTPLYQIPSRL
ncbi:MAG: uncharacterized protein K0S63_956 [Gammaproteobacteria bacterium]|jgi:hypothetical protein|nr:uncharacterized protein [Gammaproteobacteria bacterium]